MIRLGKNLSPLCFLPSGQLLCYRRGNLLVVKNYKIELKHRVFFNFKERVLGNFGTLFRLLRLGVRAAEAIDNDHILLNIGNSISEYSLSKGELSKGFFVGEGIRPLIFTIVKGIIGINDGVYFGGYRGNNFKEQVHVYKRIAIDQWEIVYTFAQGMINHIHNIVADPYRNCLWVFTGDFDEAAAIWKITDNFKKVERVLCNKQMYRGCVVFPVKQGLLYATDAPFAQNYVYLLKDDFTVVQLREIDGSCIYGCQVKDKYVFSTTVEPDGRTNTIFNLLFSRKRGAGIRDMYTRMYVGDISGGFKEVYKVKKDILPYLFQFGVIRFPYGVNTSEKLYFQPVATNKHDLDLLVIDDVSIYE